MADAAGHRRLDDANDFVRLEIEAALSRQVRVIPILVEGARMPRADELPASLAGLVRRQALVLDPSHFAADLGRLQRVIDKTLAEARVRAAATPLEPTPAPAVTSAAASPAVAGSGGRSSPGRARRLVSDHRRLAAGVVAVLAVLLVIAVLATRHKPSPSDNSTSSDDTSGAYPALVVRTPYLDLF